MRENNNEGYWWCPHCEMEKSPIQVTNDEKCTFCGNAVYWYTERVPFLSKTVTNVTLNGKYRISYKQADTKGILGFTVEANSDDLETCVKEAQRLLASAEVEAKIYAANQPIKIDPPLAKEK